MTCYKPLLRVEYPRCPDGKTKDGRRKNKFEIYKLDNLEKNQLEREYLNNKIYFNREKYGLKPIVQIIPCGKCVGCRLEYSKDWATRCVCEAKEWKENWFITLTYNDENIPYKDKFIYTNENNEKITFTDDGTWNGYLKPEDLTNFLKRLREKEARIKNHENIRYFSCGEYGDNTQRPHYHAIMFNLNIEDIELLKYDENGNPLYKSKYLDEIWGKGHVFIAEVNWSTCAYVARYIMKKIKGKESIIDYYAKGQTPEFTRMSRMPGIGKTYIEKNWKKVYKHGYILAMKYDKTLTKCRPPKYFNDWLKENHPEEYKKYKHNNIQKQLATERAKALLTDNDMLDMLNIDATIKNTQVSKLIRTLE